MSGQLVLVTGVTGFVAGHVVEQLLEAGYRVRGTARSGKISQLSEAAKVPNLEIVAIDDVATSDFTSVLQGVDAIVHVAAYMPFKADVDETIKGAVDGTLNILKTAKKLGITDIVVTSTFGTLLDPALIRSFGGGKLTEKDFGSTTVEEARAHADNGAFVYFAAKILAEKALWEYVKLNPELDVRAVNPGFIYGPFSKIFPFPPNPQASTTNAFIYGLINGQEPFLIPPYFVDVRDVAKSHVLALTKTHKKLPHEPEKRRFISNAGILGFDKILEIYKAKYGDAIKSPAKLPDLPGVLAEIDASYSNKVLEFGGYIPYEKTLEDLYASLKEAEKIWNA